MLKTLRGAAFPTHIQHTLQTLSVRDAPHLDHSSYRRTFLQGNNFIHHSYSQAGQVFTWELAAVLDIGKARPGRYPAGAAYWLLHSSELADFILKPRNLCSPAQPWKPSCMCSTTHLLSLNFMWITISSMSSGQVLHTLLDLCPTMRCNRPLKYSFSSAVNRKANQTSRQVGHMETSTL